MPPGNEKLRKILAFVFPGVRLNKSLRILVAANSVFNFIVGLFTPFYAVFVERIGGSIALAGLSWAIFSVVAGILIFLFSNWELKVKEQELLIALGYILRGGVFLGYVFMTNIEQLIILQLFWGIAVALGTPAFDSVYASHTTQEAALVEWGAWEGIASIVGGIAAFVGGFLIQVFGFQTVFVIMSVLSVGLGIYIWRLPREIL